MKAHDREKKPDEVVLTNCETLITSCWSRGDGPKSRRWQDSGQRRHKEHQDVGNVTDDSTQTELKYKLN